MNKNMKAIYIDVSNDGSNLDRCCNSTLTVGELIDILKTYDLDRPICLRHCDAYGDGCAYGMITDADINLSLIHIYPSKTFKIQDLQGKIKIRVTGVEPAAS